MSIGTTVIELRELKEKKKKKKRNNMDKMGTLFFARIFTCGDFNLGILLGFHVCSAVKSLKVEMT